MMQQAHTCCEGSSLNHEKRATILAVSHHSQPGVRHVQSHALLNLASHGTRLGHVAAALQQQTAAGGERSDSRFHLWTAPF